MRVRNVSRYPTDEVKRLVQFGMKGVDTARLYVRVGNTERGVAGRAYDDKPNMSPTRHMATVDRLVTLRVGPAFTFPCDNMVIAKRWVDITEDEYERLAVRDRRDCRHTTYSDGRAPRIQREMLRRHPYGGLRSPFIRYEDWREGLVALAAHEARHIHQFRYDKPKSEVEAERFALKRLMAFRAGAV